MSESRNKNSDALRVIHSAVQYDALLAKAEQPAQREMVLHNLAVLQWVVGGTEMALTHELPFDPRQDYWYRPERRLGIAFLATRFPTFPPLEQGLLLAELAVFVLRFLDGLRPRGVVTYHGVDYDEAPGGREAIFGAIADELKSLPARSEWAELRKKNDPPTLAQALELFARDVAASGFGNTTEAVRTGFRWFPYLGAATVDQALAQQRYFFGFSASMQCTNAYKHAGAQSWGPLLTNTPHAHFTSALRAWREGTLPNEAPLLAMGKNDTEPTPRQDYSGALEVWGMLNLERGPFYNGVVQQELAAVIAGREPIDAMLTIGRATYAWLDAHPEQEKTAAARFRESLPVARPHNNARMLIARRCKDGEVTPDDPVDEALQAELYERARARILGKGERACAAMWLHLALDASLYTTKTGANEATATRAAGVAESAAPYGDEGREADEGTTRMWLYAPGAGAQHWTEDHTRGEMSIGWHELSDLREFGDQESVISALAETGEYQSRRPLNSARSCWHFANDIVEGDWVIAREGRSTLIGVGRVAGDYDYAPDADALYPHRRKVNWLWVGRHRVEAENSLPVSTLVDASGRGDLRDAAGALARGAAPGAPDVRTEDDAALPYTMKDALADLFMDQSEVERLLRLIRRKKNLVLQGPPGVGKTFFARRLAYLIMGESASTRVSLVQFHQAYTYEHLVAGFTPDGHGGFVLKHGPLFLLAAAAQGDPDNDYVLLVDEINRGNLSKILGEAMMLLESDKRDPSWGLRLSYGSDQTFYLPKNLYVIGTMNTADRSLAMVDYALRRRFAFATLEPGLEHERFAAHLSELPPSLLTDLRRRVAAVNKLILDDPMLGRGFLLGHSPFCGGPPAGEEPERWLRDVCEYELLPLLEEYWFDAPERLDTARRALLGET